MGKLEKKTLSSQVAELLAEKINQGELVGSMPGENDLAEELSVSRRTIRGAMVLLEKMGAVSESSRGRKRKIHRLGKRLKAKRKVINVLLPRSRELMNASAQHLIRLIRVEAEQSGHEFNIYEASYKERNDLTASAAEVLSIHQADIWIVWESNEKVADFLHERGMVSIGIGGSRGESTSMHMVYYDLGSAVKHCLNKLFEKGHKYVCFPIVGGLRKELYESIFEQYGITTSADYCFPKFTPTKEDYIKLLSRTFARDEVPTAMICGSDRLLTLVTWLGKHGLKVPEDVSVINIGHENFMEEMVPRINYYSTSPKPIAHKVKSLVNGIIEQHKDIPKDSFIYTEYVEGDSLRTLV